MRKASTSPRTCRRKERTRRYRPKERFEISAEGRTASCNNFRVTEFSRRRNFRTVSQDKGQQNEISTVIRAVQEGKPSPLPLDAIVNVSRVTFAMLESARSGREITLG